MNVGFQIDEVGKLNHKTDSTLPIILESQKRKNKNFCFLPSSLTYKNNFVFASVKEIKPVRAESLGLDSSKAEKILKVKMPSSKIVIQNLIKSLEQQQ